LINLHCFALSKKDQKILFSKMHLKMNLQSKLLNK